MAINVDTLEKEKLNHEGILTINDETFNFFSTQLEFLHNQFKGHLCLILCHLDECQKPHLTNIGFMVQPCTVKQEMGYQYTEYVYGKYYNQHLKVSIIRTFNDSDRQFYLDMKTCHIQI